MVVDFSAVQFFANPSLIDLKSNHVDFLMSLSGLTVIDVTGKNRRNCRVITTLLHGNEPSGFIAVHKWLTELANQQVDADLPATNIRIILGSVEAAQQLPVFSQRYLADGLDINRCFGSKHQHGYYQRAQLITELIEQVQPQAIVDLHNTSGQNPAFAVSAVDSAKTKGLASLFCNTMVLSHIHIGALMEQQFSGAIVTIECGGCAELASHHLAYQGIKAFASCSELFTDSRLQAPIKVIYRPLRLVLNKHINLSYAQSNTKVSGLILTTAIEQFNFGLTRQQTVLGWFNGMDHELTAQDCFELIDEQGCNQFQQFFSIKNNEFTCNCDMIMFMATSQVNIARTDCLFYVVQA